MDLHHLRTFIVVAEEQNVTRAAERLFTTPPSVSTHIKMLEEELNVTLFDRSPRGMKLTEKGALLREKAAKVLIAAQDMVNQATTLQAELMGAVRIGINAASDFLRIARIAEHLRDRHPGIELEYAPHSSGRVLEQLEEGTLDAGFVFGTVPDAALWAKRLTVADLVVGVPTRWAEQTSGAGWRELSRLPWIYSSCYCPFQTLLDETFAGLGLEYERAVQAGDDAVKFDLTASGLGLTLLERTEAEAGVRREKLAIWEPIPALQTTLSFVCRKNRREAPLIKAVIETVDEAWNKTD